MRRPLTSVSTDGAIIAAFLGLGKANHGTQAILSGEHFWTAALSGPVSPG
jgi:hypothetical protein